MLPLLNSAPQQGMPSNQSQGTNSSNVLPNSGQIQPQMGIMNPQIAVPFNNPHTNLNNGNLVVPNGPILTPSHCFMNSPNPAFPLPNGTSPFVPQNLNSIAMNQMNSSQPSGLFFAHNTMNPTQFLNQNISLPNGQFFFPRPVQNMNQFVPMQLPNYGQVFPGNLPLGPNQVSQVMGSQIQSFGSNPQLGIVQQLLPNAAQQLQGNIPLPLGPGFVQQQQTQNTFLPPVSSKPQENPVKDGRSNRLHTNRKNSHNRNLSKNPNCDSSNGGFKRSRFPHMQTVQGKSRFHNEHDRKGYNNDGARKSNQGISTNQIQEGKKRPLSLIYTEQEIKQWREERRKNYPSKANINKKMTSRLTGPDVTNNDAELRRQQLKDILTKQAELGCEVAEIPSHYLSDSEQPVHAREENRRPFSKKGKFQNRFDKRRKFHQNDRFAKRQRLADQGISKTHDKDSQLTRKQQFEGNDSSSRHTANHREPTLLHKLLSADIKRDKRHLLQVFRFMVMNSFFKDWPDKTLRFPSVVVKETGVESDAVEEIPSHVKKGVEKANTAESNNSDDDDNCNEVETNSYVGEKWSIQEELDEEEEEEGEIIN